MAFKQYTDKQVFALWEEFADSIRSSTTINKFEAPGDRKTRIAYLEANPEEWFVYYFPKFAYAAPAKFHKQATARIINNPEWYEVRNWSRELAKSTRTMMEVMYLTLTGKKRFVVLVSNSIDNAERLLMPYKANLEFNPRIMQDYGMQERPGSWGSAVFTTRKKVMFRAVGAGQSPRGAKNDEVRPDVLLFDDIDTDEECRNTNSIINKWKWIEEAAIGTRSISAPTLIIFCGNIIAKDCCVVRAAKYADHTSIVNIRDDNGKSTWAKNTEAHIDRVLSQKSYAATQKEYFNNPIDEGSVFKELNYKQLRPLKDYRILVMYTDPSYKSGKKNDYKASHLVGQIGDEFHVLKSWCEQTTTSTMIDWQYEADKLVANKVPIYFIIEWPSIDDALKLELADATTRHGGRIIPLKADERTKLEKFSRIESLLEPLNRRQKLWFNINEKNNPHTMRTQDQFLALAPGSRAHDDSPDAVEGAVFYLNNKNKMANHANITIGRKQVNPKRY
jgi:hypothetical protein